MPEGLSKYAGWYFRMYAMVWALRNRLCVACASRDIRDIGARGEGVREKKKMSQIGQNIQCQKTQRRMTSSVHQIPHPRQKRGKDKQNFEPLLTYA